MARTGRPFSVAMTNCGHLGWVSDKTGYRYQENHPSSGTPWPPMPDMVLKIWRDYANYEKAPEACLINYYAPGARMGLHVDADEEEQEAPVLSISLGDTARFRLGGQARRDRSCSFDLISGDILVLSGPSRLAYHGVTAITSRTSCKQSSMNFCSLYVM